jgi:hypothetical protein
VRTRGTRRRLRLAALCARAPALLLSATPVHNGLHDVAALLALFLGDLAAERLDAATLAHLVVRRRRRDVAGVQPGAAVGESTTGDEGLGAPQRPGPNPGPVHIPRVTRTVWQPVPGAASVLSALVALPPPVPPADRGRAPALATVTLVRLWASSDAAVRAALRRRLARAAALAHALAAGVRPSERDLATWAADEAAVQLPLLFGAGGEELGWAESLARHVAAHEAGLRNVLRALDAVPPADPARVAFVLACRRRHPGVPLVAFAQSADTARAIYRALAPGGRVALLTAAGGRIASGPIPRAALLARFAPRAQHSPPPAAAERVDLLVATDCVSEGLDLSDAGVVVHLDVPWTPARIAQRVGRAARLGAPRDVVTVYGLRPAGAVEAWLRLARRLRVKAAAARLLLGGGASGAQGGVRSSGAPAVGGRAFVHRLRNMRRLERWLVDGSDACDDPLAHGRPGPSLHAVRCGRSGFLTVWHPGGSGPPVVLAAIDGRPVSAAPRRVGRALRCLELPAAAGSDSEASSPSCVEAAHAAAAAVDAWARRRAARAAVGHHAAPALHLGSAPSRTRRSTPPAAAHQPTSFRRRADEALAWAAHASPGSAAPASRDPSGPRLTVLVLLVP